VSGESSELSTRELVTCWGLVEEGFRNTHRALAADIEGAGLPVQWFEVLIRLLRTPEQRLPMNRLAADIDMTSGGYTKLVDRLEAANLVERVPAVDDRRVIYTSLTDGGRKAAEKALRRHETHLREVVLGPLSTEQLRSLAELMRVLRDAHRGAVEDRVNDGG
jgi:DNA-binding MarR family transcriptional regulator